MPRLYEEWGLRDVLGRSCHASLSMCAEARKLDGCYHDAGEDEAAPKKAMGLRTSPTQEERKDGGADRLEREGETGGLGGHVGLHERLGDKAVGRADEREGNDDHDLAGRTGKCETAKDACGNAENRPPKPSCQTPRDSGSTSSTKRLATIMWLA